MRRLGRYELGTLLGVGGAGKVHEAVLVGPGGLRKPVALKVLHRGGEALRREAVIGGLLRHRNLVDVYEIGEVDGEWFCALELCAGCLAKHQPLPPRAVVEVGLQVCAALQYAHEELGLVHLDIKPDNLLFDADGVVKVADLGIARAEGFESKGVRGTPHYMAPEQARGEPVDMRADIFALGITLVELATGRRTSRSETLDLDSLGPTFETMSADDFDAPRPALPGVPDWMAPAVARCLEDAPADRWPDMASLAEAIRALPVEGPGLREALGLAERKVASLQRADTNLGPEPDAFVGRQVERALLSDLLQRSGLVTLKGPGGIGKTRLATMAAREHHATHGGQAWFCDLTEAHSAHGVLSALARTLDLSLGRQDPVVQLGHALAGRGPCVLVLDNFEQIVEAAPMVSTWTAQAPELRVIATSRVALGLEGERLVEIQPMDPSAAADLLVARALQRGVDLVDDPAVPELARRLDGVPLALELAAGRLGVLPPAEVLDRLGLGLLRAASDGRHGTLRAAMEWSWDLLSERDRSVLAQLSVFAGSFRLEAAERVVDLPGGSVLDAVASLIDQSMTVSDRGGRFRLLTSIRAFAWEKLEDPEPALARHGAWCAGLFTGSGPNGSMEQLTTLTAEVDNLIAAVDRAIDRADGPVAAGALEGAWEALDLSGPHTRAVELGERVVAMDLSPRWRSRAARVLGQALRRTGRRDEAFQRFLEALASAREAGDRMSESEVLGNLGTLRHQMGQMDEAHRYYLDALQLDREVGNLPCEGEVLGNLAAYEQEHGRFDEAIPLYTQALDVHRRAGDRRSEGLVLGNFAILHRFQGRLDEARAHYEAALAIHREVGNRQVEGIVHGNLGNLDRRMGRDAEALAHYDAALTIHREIGNRESAGIVRGNLGVLNREQGDLAASRRHLEAALPVTLESGNIRFRGWLLTELARTELASGQPEAARSHADAAVALFRDSHDHGFAAQALAVQAEARWRSGDMKGATQALAEAEAIAPESHAEAQADLERVRRLFAS